MFLPPFTPKFKEETFFILLRQAIIRRYSHENNTRSIDPGLVDSLSNLQNYSDMLWGLLPLIHYNLTDRFHRDKLPIDISHALKDYSVRVLASNLINELWLQRVLTILEKENIAVILLKSSAFSSYLYASDLPRAGKDIDILVPSKKFENACRALKDILQSIPISKNRPLADETLFERVFRPKNKSGPTVEIHRGLTNPGIFNINEDMLWKNSKPHPRYKNNMIRVLSPEDTILHLSIHAFRDLDFCSHSLIDTHEAICQWKPDFNLLIKQSKEWGASNVLFCLLENCRVALDTPIPISVLSDIRPIKVRFIMMKLITGSVSLNNRLRKNLSYRLTQLFSQLTFPDSIFQGLTYQVYYINTRLKDLFTSRNPRI